MGLTPSDAFLHFGQLRLSDLDLVMTPVKFVSQQEVQTAGRAVVLDTLIRNLSDHIARRIPFLLYQFSSARLGFFSPSPSVQAIGKILAVRREGDTTFFPPTLSLSP